METTPMLKIKAPLACAVCGGACVQKCAMCGSAGYCSSACQTKDWKRHCGECLKMQGRG